MDSAGWRTAGGFVNLHVCQVRNHIPVFHLLINDTCHCLDLYNLRIFACGQSVILVSLHCAVLIFFLLLFFSLETNYDVIHVYDGPTAQFSLLGSLTGSQRASFNSSSRYMTVVFSTDGSVTQQGFRAEWTFKCTYLFNLCQVCVCVSRTNLSSYTAHINLMLISLLHAVRNVCDINKFKDVPYKCF